MKVLAGTTITEPEHQAIKLADHTHQYSMLEYSVTIEASIFDGSHAFFGIRQEIIKNWHVIPVLRWTQDKLFFGHAGIQWA